MDASAEEPLRAVENGFAWLTPSRGGLVAHSFDNPGIFFYTDQNYEAVASYVGVIVVLPAPRKHYFELTKDGGIKPDLACVEVRDQLWWVWNSHEINMKEQPFVMEIERCVGGGEGTTLTFNHCGDRCDLLTDAEQDVIAQVGLQMTIPKKTGIYQYRLSNCGPTIPCASVVVVPGSSNSFVTVADDGYSPRILSIKCGDTVWWTWQDTQAAHNIYEVSQSGDRIAGGFNSGGLLEAPAAASCRFDSPGIFYYCSQSLPILCGIVQVYSQPVITPIYVNELTLQPNLSRVGDIVAWIFQNCSALDIKSYDLTGVLQELTPLAREADKEYVCPRRVFSRTFSKQGVYHFFSEDFGGDEAKEPHQLQHAQTTISSIIVDEIADAYNIRVSKTGFTPSSLTIYKGTSICWRWHGTNEEHNIVYVRSPTESEPLKAIDDMTAFTSGDMMGDSQFVFTFPLAGEFWVASEGAPGHACCVTVLGHPLYCERPYISSSKNGGVVGYGEVVQLATNNQTDTIYYTLDSSFPEFSNPHCIKYIPQCPIRLTQTGFQFIRAICFNSYAINSQEMVSMRFEVQRKQKTPIKQELAPNPAEAAIAYSLEIDRLNNEWLACTPVISAFFSIPGTLVVTWSYVHRQELVKGYQVFLNNISYCSIIPRSATEVTCSGLSGGVTYSVKFIVYSTQPQCFPIESNTVTVVCPETTLQGGPLVSLRLSRYQDSITCVWKHLSRPDIEGYLICLNGLPQGEPVVPKTSNRECVKTIENLSLNMLYKLFVTPISSPDITIKATSNKLAFKLPLDTKNITYPSTNILAAMPKALAEEFISIVQTRPQGNGEVETLCLRKAEETIVVDHVERNLVSSKPTGKTKLRSGLPPRCRPHQEFRTRSDTTSNDSSDDYPRRNHQQLFKRGKAGPARLPPLNASITKSSRQPQEPIQNTRFQSEKKAKEEISCPQVGKARQPTPLPRWSSSPNALESVDHRYYLTEHTDNNPVFAHFDQSTLPGNSKKNIPKEAYDNPLFDAPSHLSKPAAQSSPDLFGSQKKGRFYQDFVSTEMSELKLPETDTEDPEFDACESNGFSASEKLSVESELSYLYDQTPCSGGLYPSRMAIMNEQDISVHPVQRSERSIRQPIPEANQDYEHDPAVKLTIECTDETSVQANWYIADEWQNPVEKEGYVLSVAGVNFSTNNVPSNVSYGVQLTRWGYLVNGTEHCFHLEPSICTFRLTNLLPSTTYDFKLTLLCRNDMGDTENRTSEKCTYTTWGPPQAPTLRCTDVSEREAVVEWECRDVNEEIGITEFVIFIKPHGYSKHFGSREREAVLSNLYPGVEYNVSIVAETGRVDVGSSEHSNEITIYCPPIPPAPEHINTLPAVEAGKVTIYWPAVLIASGAEYCVLSYLVFVDGRLYDEISGSGNQFPSIDIDGLEIDEIYEVAVISRAGWSEVSPFSAAKRIVCQTLSDFSVIYPIMSTGPPVSPKVEVSNILERTIELSWPPARDYQDAKTSGYQLYINGDPYGDILDDATQSISLTGLTHGDTYTFQIVALTKHPVGQLPGDCIYSACKVGPETTMCYRGFLNPVRDIFVKQRGGHIIKLGWSLPVVGSRFSTAPDCLMVICHKRGDSQHHISNQYIMPDQREVELKNLQERTEYAVTIQCRKLVVIGGSETVIYCNAPVFNVSTLSPPKGPKNLTLTDSSTSALKFCWDNQPDPGNQITRLHIQYVPYTTGIAQPLTRELPPSASSMVLRNLFEGTEYLVSLTAVTEEYIKSGIPIGSLSEPDRRTSPWLPTISTVVSTCGTDRAKNLTIVDRGSNELALSWTPPELHGLNTLLTLVVRWVEWNDYGATDVQFSKKQTVDKGSTSIAINNLIPGTSYRISLDANVNAKMHLDSDDSPAGMYAEICISSDPIFAKTRPDIGAFPVLLTGYTKDTIQLSWCSPLQWSIARNPADDGDVRMQLWTILGYTVEKNGTDIKHLPVVSELKLSRPVVERCSVRIFAQMQRITPGRKVKTDVFETVVSSELYVRSNPDNPYVEFNAVLHRVPGIGGHKVISKWSRSIPREAMHQVLTWWIDNETNRHSKRLPSDASGAEVTLLEERCILHMLITQILNDGSATASEQISLLVPGQLAAPEIWLHKLDVESFTICWGAQSDYGLATDSYKIIVNTVEMQPYLAANVNYFEIPSKPNSFYTVHVQALSGDARYKSSELSDALEIYSGKVVESFFAAAGNNTNGQENYIPVKAEDKLGKTITLTWPKLPPAIQKELLEYRIVWSSNGDPQKHESSVRIGRTKFRLQRTVQGDTYYFRLFLISHDNRIVHQSQEITITTSASPSAPVLRLKASNLRYVCIEWDKPVQYGHCLIQSYTVLQDGSVISQVPCSKTNHTITDGKACQQYVFQVGCNTSMSTYDASLSEPLLVTWPGVKPPEIRHVPTTSTTEIEIEWDKPVVTGGLRLASFTATCTEDAEPLHRNIYKQVIGPLHPECRHARFTSLPETLQGFAVKLTTKLHGFPDEFDSPVLQVLPGVAPNPPVLYVETLGLSQRRNLEENIRNFCRRRDRLMQSIHIEAHECHFGMCDLSTNFEMFQLSDTLYRIEQLLSESLQQVQEYTGNLHLGISWTKPQEVPRAPVTKYRLYVDGTQFGNDFTADVLTTNISLSLDQQKYSLNMRSVRQLPEILSVLSNTIQVTSTAFQPFTYFCLHHIHKPSVKYPEAGCCAYNDTWIQEIHTNSSTTLCPGPLHSQRFFPALSGILVGKGTSVALVKVGFESFPKSQDLSAERLRNEKKLKKPKVLLFWTPWCKASQVAVKLFVQAAGEINECNFVTCAFDPHTDGPGEWEDLGNSMNEDGLLKNQSVRHTTVSRDAIDGLRIFGVPTFVFVHANGTMAYQGRFPIATVSETSRFIKHVLSRMKKVPCQSSDCFLCEPLLLAITATDKDTERRASALLPALQRPLEVTPAYPPAAGNPYMFDPFLARWHQYSPHRPMPYRRVPWCFYDGDFSQVPHSPLEKPKKRRDDFKELPPIQCSVESPDYSTSTRRQSQTRIPWFKPRRSVLMQQRQRSLSWSSARRSTDGSGTSGTTISNLSFGSGILASRKPPPLHQGCKL